MSIQSEIDRISGNVSDTMSALSEYGVDTTGANSDDLAGLVRAIPKATIVQGTGDSTTDVMSQAAVTAALNQLGNEIVDLQGGALPDYWETHITQKVAEVNNWLMAGGKDCFSFPLLTDIHIRHNLGKYSGILARRILDECYLPYAVCVGDVANRGSEGESDMEEDFVTVEALLAPIRDRLLQTQGNHDGAWGYLDYDGDGDKDYYAYNFKPEKLHALIYRKVGLVGECHFDTSGTGYWIDDVSSKVRYIVLNTHNNPYEEDANGFAVYNHMTSWKFQQSQFDMVVEACETVPGDDWSVVSFSHIPLNYSTSRANLTLMAQLLNAYQDKTAFAGSFAGEHGWDAISVDVDFSSAKGQYVAHFAGHTHLDTAAVYQGITVITTRCDGANEPSGSGLAKTAGTVTEQSFDVFTVNRKEKKIYVTKIGAGENRYWDYENGVEFDPNAMPAGTYNIITNLTNCTGASSNPTTIKETDNITLTFVPDEFFVFPTEVLVSGATYLWAINSSGEGLLTLTYPTGDVTVTITAAELDGSSSNIIDEVGYTDGFRLSTSSGNLSELAGYTTTGLIAVPSGSTIKTYGVDFNYKTGTCNIVMYNSATGSMISSTTLYGGHTTGWNGFTWSFDDAGNMTMNYAQSNGATAYIKICGYGSGMGLVVMME